MLIALLVGLFAFGCNQKKMDQLEQTNLQLKETTARQDSLLNGFLHTFNEIEDNLVEIKQKEQLIEVNAQDPEFTPNQKERIIANIEAIDTLMIKNREMIAGLNKQIARSNGKRKEFQRLVSRLNDQLVVRDTSIAQLKRLLVNREGEIQDLAIQVQDLTTITQRQSSRMATQDSTIVEQDQEIQAQTHQLNTAYFIVGTAKELVEKKILAKGGLLGKKTVNTDFDETLFQEIDVTQTQTLSIPVDTKKAKLLTNHPSNSYVLNGDKNTIESLEITNPQEFWKQSKYLVVVLN